MPSSNVNGNELYRDCENGIVVNLRMRAPELAHYKHPVESAGCGDEALVTWTPFEKEGDPQRGEIFVDGQRLVPVTMGILAPNDPSDDAVLNHYLAEIKIKPAYHPNIMWALMEKARKYEGASRAFLPESWREEARYEYEDVSPMFSNQGYLGGGRMFSFIGEYYRQQGRGRTHCSVLVLQWHLEEHGFLIRPYFFNRPFPLRLPPTPQ